MHTVIVLALACSGTVTEIPQFTGDISESWQGFQNYMFNPDFHEASPATIFGGQATITNPVMAIYEPGFAEFGLGSSGLCAQVADGTKAMGLNGPDQTAVIEFATPVTEFGAWWGGTTGGKFPDPNTIAVSFYDADGVLIEMLNFEYSHSIQFDGVLDWHGWSISPPAATITYKSDFVAIDALQANQSSACPGDLDGDGEVGINDFLDLLAAWGPNPGHAGDLDGDDIVGINDFLMLLAAWGPCP
jgi:hypothetical protein